MKFSDIELPSNRKFGFFFTAVFAIAGAYFLWKDNLTVASVLFAIMAAFFVITLIKDDLLLPLNKLWMGLGLLLGMIISPIVLGIIFFLLFTPIAVVTKLFGRDELRLKVKSQPSYWKLRATDATDAGTFRNQF